MHGPAIELTADRNRPFAILWVLLLLFAAANVLPVFPLAFPPILYPAAQIIPAMLFALVHAGRVYGVRGSAAFAGISIALGYVMEIVGTHTGFPFGHYYFTGGMGPKLFAVPILMGPAYLGMGYIAWTVARTVFGPDKDGLSMAKVVMLPMAAGFVMVAWDLCFDPSLSTVGRYWTWTRGGAYFGVPISNFLGWYLTNFLIYQAFALYMRRRSMWLSFMPAADARLAVIFYAVCAAGCVLRAASKPFPAYVVDPAGVLWRVSDINNVGALAAVFVMGPFVLLASSRLLSQSREVTLTAYESSAELSVSHE